jgi:hypothetical protein
MTMTVARPRSRSVPALSLGLLVLGRPDAPPGVAYAERVSRLDDDDDWVGTPPEGRYTRDRAKPEFWWRQRPVSVAAAGLVLVIIVLIIIALAH